MHKTRFLHACAVTALVMGGGAWAQSPQPEASAAPEAPIVADSVFAAPEPLVAPLNTGVASAEETAEPSAATPIDRILQTQGGAPALSGQNIDPNQSLLTALTRARREGALLRVSPERVFLNFEEGGSGSERIRVNNLGDTTANIRGINAIAPIDGFLVTTGCGETLEPGAFCDIAVSFASNSPREIFTAIVIGVEERDRTSIEIPVEINVEARPVAPTPVEDTSALPSTGLPINPNDPRYAQPLPPTSTDIARAYYGAAGGIEGMETGPMSVVSLPDHLRRPEEPYIDTLADSLSVDTIRTDPRYPDSVASTEASLPVDRSNIVTADRVIKAVLDTPFSNVMCGKVVAVVESDVYSATSSQALIPSGSRVLGRCGELVQERAGIVWERIITTDGRSISLAGEDSMTRDASGLGGALGRVYRTPFDRYVLPIFGTFVDIGAGFVQAEYGENEEQSVTETGTVVQGSSARNKGIETATTAVQERSQAIIQEMADVREVMIVPAGTRIDIEIFEDIYFKNEREIVRLGDTVYNVASPEASDIAVDSPYSIALEPYRPGLEGPVVNVGGRRYVVRESQALASIPGTPTDGSVPQGATPQPVAGNGRPVASSPTATTQGTLSDLNQPAR